MTYKISAKAIADVENIWLYTYENWSAAQADRYINLIFDEIEHLVLNPSSGKDLGQLRKNYRCSKVKSHLIFYRIIDECIEIIRILHRQMDIENKLND